jgi:hypothetical protein
MSIFGIDPEGSIVREHDLAALDEAGHDLEGYELFWEDDQSGELFAADGHGALSPIDPSDLLSQLPEADQELFKTFHDEGRSSFPDAAEALGNYLEKVAEHFGAQHDDVAAITDEVHYELWRDEQLEEAARDLNIAQPKTFEAALEASYADGLLGNRERAPAKPTGDLMGDAMNGFVEQLSDRNNVQQAARAAVRAAARDHAGSSEG